MLGRLVRKSVAMPQFASVCNCPQNLAPSSRKLPTHLGDLWEVGRPPRDVTSHWPTTFCAEKPEKEVGQLVILVGRPIVAAEFQFAATESKKGHDNVFARYVYTTTLPIIS